MKQSTIDRDDMSIEFELRLSLTPILTEHIAFMVGQDGSYASAGEYIRDLIRRDLERVELQRFERLRSELRLSLVQLESRDVKRGGGNIVR